MEKETKKEIDWIFTFGHGHIDARGKSLLHNYVVIHGTFQSARMKMFEKFGAKWGFQYPSKEKAKISEWNLSELKV